MSIIVKKDGKKVYETKGYMSYEDKKKADILDEFLEKEVPKMENRLSRRGLLRFKNRPGAIKLWYNVGSELRSLWEAVKQLFGLPDTYLPIFLRAVFDHSNAIRPGSGRSKRLRNAYFYYCYLIAGHPWKRVQAAGNWRSWVEFLDSRRIRDDLRIVEWFASRPLTEIPNTRTMWFRKVTRAIRSELKEIDTTVLDRNELFSKLDSILYKIRARS